MRSKWLSAMLLAALAAPNATSAATRLTAAPEIESGHPWVSCTGVPPERYYPAAAQRANIEGATKVQCRPKPDGAMSACSWIEETPPGHGFGQAAAALGCMMKTRPSAEPLPPGYVLQFPLRFTLPK